MGYHRLLNFKGLLTYHLLVGMRVRQEERGALGGKQRVLVGG